MALFLAAAAAMKTLGFIHVILILSRAKFFTLPVQTNKGIVVPIVVGLQFGRYEFGLNRVGFLLFLFAIVVVVVVVVVGAAGGRRVE